MTTTGYIRTSHPTTRRPGGMLAAPALVVAVLVVLAAGAAASLLAAAPAAAAPSYTHDGATACETCHAPGTGVVTNADCQKCHGFDFQTAGATCWRCHRPGADMNVYMTSTGCTLQCHLKNPSNTLYEVPFTHGATPHLGADYAPCLQCHGVTVNAFNPDDDPHHDAVVAEAPTCQDCHDGVMASLVANHDAVDPPCESCHSGMNIPAQPASCNGCHAAATYGKQVCTDCHSEAGTLHMAAVHTTDPSVPACTASGCHSGYLKHANKKGCSACHSKVTKFHHGVTASVTTKGCNACHDRTHGGKRVKASKCASCHKGNAPASKPRAQHSVKITNNRPKCGSCHSQRVHASADGGKLTCRTCHAGHFHGRQSIPGSTVCSNCHGRLSHASGYACLTCHRGVVHDATPSGGSVVGG